MAMGKRLYDVLERGGRGGDRQHSNVDNCYYSIYVIAIDSEVFFTPRPRTAGPSASRSAHPIYQSLSWIHLVEQRLLTPDTT